MNLLLVLFLTKVLADSDDDSRYVDLLPDEEKRGFLDKVASRFKKDVRSSNSEETSQEKKVQDDFVASVVEHEIQNRRKNDDEADVQKSVEDINVTPVKTPKKSGKPIGRALDFTRRDENSDTVNYATPKFIKVDVVTENVPIIYKSDKKQETKSNDTSPTFVIKKIEPKKSLRRNHKKRKTTESPHFTDTRKEAEATTDTNYNFEVEIKETKNRDVTTDKIEHASVKSEVDEVTTVKTDVDSTPTAPIAIKTNSEDEHSSEKKPTTETLTTNVPESIKKISEEDTSYVEDPTTPIVTITAPATIKINSGDESPSKKHTTSKILTTIVPESLKMNSEDESSSVEDPTTQTLVHSSTTELKSDVKITTDSYLSSQARANSKESISDFPANFNNSEPAIDIAKAVFRTGEELKQVDTDYTKTIVSNNNDASTTKAFKDTIIEDKHATVYTTTTTAGINNDTTHITTDAPTTELNKPENLTNATENDEKNKALRTVDNLEDNAEDIPESFELERLDDIANITNRNTILLIDAEDLNENYTSVHENKIGNRADETITERSEKLLTYVGGSENLDVNKNESKVNALRINLEMSVQGDNEEGLERTPYQVYEISSNESPFIEKQPLNWHPGPQSDETPFIQKPPINLHLESASYESEFIKKQPTNFHLDSASDESRSIQKQASNLQLDPASDEFIQKRPPNWHLVPASDESLIQKQPSNWHLVPASVESVSIQKQPSNWNLESKSDESQFIKNSANNQPENVQREQPYYVPIYNYSPDRAYYNPANNLGPNADSVETDKVVKYTQGHKVKDFDGVSYEDNNFSNEAKHFDNNDYRNIKHKDPAYLRFKSNEDSLNDNLPILNQINDYLDHLYDNRQENEYTRSTNIKEDVRKNVQNLSIHDVKANDGIFNNDEPRMRSGAGRAEVKKMSEILSFTPDADLVPVVLRLQSMKLPVRRLEDDMGAHISVLKDMISTKNSKLDQYDWLRTAVDIRSKIHKLLRIIDAVKKEDNLHSTDLEVINYVIFVHNIAEDINLNGFANLRAFIPKPQKKKDGRNIQFKGPYDQVWLIRKPRTRRVNDEGLNKLQLFLEGLENNLYGLHSAIKNIARTTSYRTQQWFQDLKESYLTNDKQLQEVLLHLSVAKLCQLLEESTRSGAQEDYLKYVERDKQSVKDLLKEIVFAKKVLKM